MASPAANTIPFPNPAPTTAASAASPQAPHPGSGARPSSASPAGDATAFRLKPWQREVLQLLARGASIVQAVAGVGRTESAFFKACDRHPEFAALAQEAREFHRASIAEAFHDTEAFARSVVDRVLRDENQPVNLRLRAALAILNRKNPHWLPSALPDFEISPALAETLESAEAQQHPVSMDPHSGLDKLDNPAPNDPEGDAAGPVETRDAPQSAPAQPAPDAPAPDAPATDAPATDARTPPDDDPDPGLSPFLQELLRTMEFPESEIAPDTLHLLKELDKLDNPDPQPGAATAHQPQPKQRP